MLPLPNKDEPPEAQPDRFPPCLFPASNPTQTSGGDDAGTSRGHVKGVLEEQWSVIQPTLTNLAISLPAMLKAAWVLTLRCFVSVETICFGYREQVVVGNFADHGASLMEDMRTISNSMLYIIRVDSEEAIQHFLERLESSRNFLAVAAPTGYEIRVAKEQLSHHLGNTAIHYHEHGRLQSKLQSDSVVDLTLNITKTSSGQIFTGVEFWPSHTSEGMALTVLRTFQQIFSQIARVRDSSLRLQDVDFCSDHDRRMIHKLTATVSAVEEYCMHEIILKQCRLHPDRIAVCSWDGDLTYGELEDLSSRLAHHLVQLGVHPEAFVLSCFQKSTWAVVTRLAILRAGGAYISIHAANPPAYLDSVIRRTDAQVLVSDSAFANRFRHLVPTFVEVTPEWLRSLPGNTSPACETVRGDNACLVLFTSGSTGQPKGIIQTHQSYATAIRDYATNLNLGSHTRFLQFDDYAFDISNLEFLAPLAIGGCCCVPGPMKTVKNLANNINNLKANTAFLTPTVAVKLTPADVPCLELLCLGGEPLPRDLLTKWAGSTTKLINQYGMGEVAICCAYNDRVHLGNGGNIGRPASGAIWVVDVLSPEKLMPIGAVGELLIEGPHLSRRYLDHTSPRRSEATFLETAPQWMAEMHPERRSARLYRSGDLGRWNHDGTINYIGRKDKILKMDGCRIDAVEVEHQARKSLSPKDSIVVDLLGVTDGGEDPVLSAYLYLDNHPGSTAAAPEGELLLRDTTDEPFAAEKVVDIKTSIAQSLPMYMVPTVFLLTTWMPRTASNKTDRKKLHMVGQKYYLAQREKRSRSPSHAHRVQLLPI